MSTIAEEFLEQHGYRVMPYPELMASNRVPPAFKTRAAALQPAAFVLYDWDARDDEAVDAELLAGNDRDVLAGEAMEHLAEHGVIGEDAVPA